MLEWSICPIEHKTNVYLLFPVFLVYKARKIKIQKYDKGNRAYLIGCSLAIKHSVAFPPLL